MKCLQEDSNPYRLIRSQVRYPLRHGGKKTGDWRFNFRCALGRIIGNAYSFWMVTVSNLELSFFLRLNAGTICCTHRLYLLVPTHQPLGRIHLAAHLPPFRLCLLSFGRPILQVFACVCQVTPDVFLTYWIGTVNSETWNVNTMIHAILHQPFGCTVACLLVGRLVSQVMIKRDHFWNTMFLNPVHKRIVRLDPNNIMISVPV